MGHPSTTCRHGAGGLPSRLLATVFALVALPWSLSAAEGMAPTNPVEPGPGFPNLDYSVTGPIEVAPGRTVAGPLPAGTLLSAQLGYAEHFPELADFGGPGDNVPDAVTFPDGVFSGTTGRTVLFDILRGHLVVVSESVESLKGSDISRRVWDISDPTSPSELRDVRQNGFALFGQHGGYKVADGFHPGRFQVLDDGRVLTRKTDPRSDVQNSPTRAFGDLGTRGVYGGYIPEWEGWYGQAADPFSILKATADSDGSNVVETEVARWNHLAQSGVKGHPFILGNLLIYAGDHGGDTGVVVYDISDLGTPSDPKPPVLLDVLGPDANPNGGGIGAYHANLWGHFVAFPRRTKGDRVQFVDFSDPTSLRFAAELSADAGDLTDNAAYDSDTGSLSRISSGTAYIGFQDHYAFTDRYKIDLSPLLVGETPTVVLALDERLDGVNADSPKNGVDFAGTDDDFDMVFPGIDTSQFQLPVGNLLITGGLGHRVGHGSQGAAIWIHDPRPDTTPPTIAYHVPLPDAQDYSPACPLSFMIHESIETTNLVPGYGFIVRPVGVTDPQAYERGWLAYSSDDILSFGLYDGMLDEGTRYEVLFTEDALSDAVGNPLRDDSDATVTRLVDVDSPTLGIETVGVAYRFTFTTAISDRDDPDFNPRPEATFAFAAGSGPFALSGGAASVAFAASASDNDPIEWRVLWGDGTRTDWSSDLSAIDSLSHDYTTPGNYRVTFQVREDPTVVNNSTRLSAETLTFVVHEALPPQNQRPTRSSTIVADSARDQVWVVNPDNDSVTRIDAATVTDADPSTDEIPLGKRPMSVAVDAQGRAWVVCRDDDTLHVLDADGQVVAAPLGLHYGARPVSIVFDPTGTTGYVAEEGSGRVLQVDASGSPALVGHLPRRNGVNYTFFYSLGTVRSVDGLFVGNADLAPRTAHSPGFGIWEGAWTADGEGFAGTLSPEVRMHFDSTSPAQRWRAEDGVPLGFGVVYRGRLQIPAGQAADDYVFHVSAGGKGVASVRIDGQMVLDTAAGMTTSGAVDLSAGGLVDIEVRYLNPGGGRTLLVEYESAAAGLARQEVPATALFPQQETRKPRALAISGDGQRLLVSQFIADATNTRIASFDRDAGSWHIPIALRYDTQNRDNPVIGRGTPNYLAGLAIHFDNRTAWYAGAQANNQRGAFRDNDEEVALDFETTIRARAGAIDLALNSEPTDFVTDRVYPLRVDVDNAAQLSALAFGTLGTKVFLAQQGNNRVVVHDAGSGRELDVVDVGLAPQGLAFTGGPGDWRLWVHNFMSRDVHVIDATTLIERGSRSLAEAGNAIATVVTVADERHLDAEVLRGKQIFYSARDVEDGASRPIPEDEVTGSFESAMSTDGYISCAVCHLDGGQDGMVWDFTDRGEGLRNTISLRGRRGMGHGNVHWSGNFDEIQDFENDMVRHFGGLGFTFSGPHAPLGTANADRHPDLDALAAYVTSLDSDTFPRSPYRDPQTGGLTAAAERGRQHFDTLDCASCHNPDTSYTDSVRGLTARLHDIGTIKADGRSGQRLGEHLPGIDTPTLLGVHATAPYLHDGSAATLDAVFNQFRNGGAHDITSLTRSQRGDLITYLLSLDGQDDSAADDGGDGGGAGTVGFARTAWSVSHDAGSVGPFTVIRTGSSSGAVSVQWRTSQSGTAIGGVDYESGVGTLRFDDGVVSQQIPARAIYPDRDADAEDFELVLGQPQGGLAIETSTASTHVIINGVDTLVSASTMLTYYDDNGDGVFDSGSDSLIPDLLKAGYQNNLNRDYVAVAVFALPADWTATDLAQLSSVSLTATLKDTDGYFPGGAPNVDVHALAMRSTATVAGDDWDAFYATKADSGISGTKVGEDFLTVESAEEEHALLASEAQDLAAFVAANYSQTNRYLVLRFNVDEDDGTSNKAYALEATGDPAPPQLQISLDDDDPSQRPPNVTALSVTISGRVEPGTREIAIADVVVVPTADGAYTITVPVPVGTTTLPVVLTAADGSTSRTTLALPDDLWSNG